MPRPTRIQLAQLHVSLVNLPQSVCNTLIARNVVPQSVAVEISDKKGASAYFGWSGLASSSPQDSSSRGTNPVLAGSRKQIEATEIDSRVAASCGLDLKQDATVNYELIRDPPIANSVTVTPATVDDWEIVESNAGLLEEHLMEQVRIIKPGASLTVFVDQTPVLFHVDSYTISDSQKKSSRDIARLGPGSEIAVAPRIRENIANASSQEPLQKDRQERKFSILRVLPVNLKGISESLSVNSEEPAIVVSSKNMPFITARASVTPLVRKSNLVDLDDGTKNASSKNASENQITRTEVAVFHSPLIPYGHALPTHGLCGILGSFPTTGLDSQIKFSWLKVEPTSANVQLEEAPSTNLGNASHQDWLTSGYDNLKSEVVGHILAGNTVSNTQATGTLRGPIGVFLGGMSGSGKTSLVRDIANELSSRHFIHVVFEDCAKHFDSRSQPFKSSFREWVDKACWAEPACLVLDNLDRILPAETENMDSTPILRAVHTFLDILLPALVNRKISLLATGKGVASLHGLVTSSHLFNLTVSITPPDRSARHAILSKIVHDKTRPTPGKSDPTQSSISPSPGLDYSILAQDSDGYLAADLRDWAERAIQRCAIRSKEQDSLVLTHESFVEARKGFTPISLRDVKLEASSVKWDDVGGLEETKNVLKETLEWPTKYGPIFASCPLRLRSGLLLYGYPGCGKTLLASAVAAEAGLNFLSVKGPEILNKYIGASEKNVRELFERAQAAKPCVLFFDEFDSIAPRRGHDSTGVTDRVVNQMLTQMDGAEGLDGVYVLAATSRPDLIDPALLRPGRLDKSLLCDMPDESDRLSIMRACARKFTFAPGVDLSVFAEKTRGLSSADIQSFIYNAHLDAINSSLAESGPSTNAESTNGTPQRNIRFMTLDSSAQVSSLAEKNVVLKRLEQIHDSLQSDAAQTNKKAAVNSPLRSETKIEMRHLEKSLATTRPSLPQDEFIRLKKCYASFVSGRSAEGLPSGLATDEIGGRSTLM